MRIGRKKKSSKSKVKADKGKAREVTEDDNRADDKDQEGSPSSTPGASDTGARRMTEAERRFEEIQRQRVRLISVHVFR